MATQTGLLTVNSKDIKEVSTDPSSGAGTAATDLGSIALVNDSGVGQAFIKTGSADTAWDRIVTANDGTFIAPGTFLRLPIFDTDPTGAHLSDTALQNSQQMHVAIAPQASRSADITYQIPNPGDAVTAADFVLTEGAQTINGNKTFGNDVIVQGILTVNGTLTYVNSTNLEVTDKLITLNKGGATASASGVGFEIEENALITGYFKTTADRNGYAFQAPNVASAFTLDFSSLSAARTVKAANASGTMVLRPNATTQVAGQVTYWSDANNVTSSSSLFWDTANGRLGIGTNAPSVELHVVGSARITGLSTAGVVHNDASGNLSTSLVSLSSDVTGVLPIANGGTNSSTALNNGRLMVSDAGSIVELYALTPGNVMWTGGDGLVGQSSSFFWDNANGRLGIGTSSPTTTLDVQGDVNVSGYMSQISTASPSAKWKQLQSQTQTTDATVTTLATIPTVSNSTMIVRATVAARRTGGSAGAANDASFYIRTVRVKNTAGTVSILTLQTDYTSEDQKAWDASYAVSSTNVLLQVQGALNNNVDWTTTYEVITLS